MQSPPTFSRRTELWLVALSVAAISFGLWALGKAIGSSLLSFAGFMVGACTFVPLPADAWVLSVAADHSAVTLGLLGGGINAVVVLVERHWVRRLMEHDAFDRFQAFVGTNRWVDRAEQHLFLGLLIGGFSFLPFEPFRLVAIMRNYNPYAYALATFLGRGLRYYLLARAGSAFAETGVAKYVVWASLILFFVGLIRSYRNFNAQGPSRPGT